MGGGWGVGVRGFGVGGKEGGGEAFNLFYLVGRRTFSLELFAGSV